MPHRFAPLAIKRGRPRSAAFLLTIVASVSCSVPLAAQDMDRYRPDTPTTGRNVVNLPVPPATYADGSPEVIIEELKGVMILADESRLQDPIKPFEGIRLDPKADLTVARGDGFKSEMQPYLGQPISILALNQLAQHIVTMYRNNGQPVVEVHMPPGQDITDGVVQVVITESKIGRIDFRGNCHFDDCLLQRQSWLRPGQNIFVASLENELLWYNKNPYRTVGVTLEPGQAAGTTDVVYSVCEQRPMRGFVGYRDTGTRSTNRERMVFGFNRANPKGDDGQFSYQFEADAQLAGRVGVHSFTYTAPIFDNRDSWTIYGSYGNLDNLLPVAGDPTDGRMWQVSLRYNHPLHEDNCRLDEMHFGLDVKGTDNDLDFGGTNIQSSDVHVLNFMAGLGSRQQYDDGYTAYGVDGYFSPGHLLSSNRDSDFSRFRSGAKSLYGYGRGYVERLYEVGARSDLFVRATGQLGSYKLLPSEQLGFGGYDTIRGYDMRTVNGDSGYILNMEYRSKPIMSCCNDKQTSLTLLTFLDAGQQFNWGAYDAALNSPDQEFLASTGVGLRYSIDPNCSLRLDYGYPLRDKLAENSKGRLHVGAVLSY